MTRLAILALFAITALMTAADVPTLMIWPDLTNRPKPTSDATLAYGPDETQKIDVWRPAGKGPFPVVLMVHGGCWTSSIADRSLMNWIAADLRRDGIAVWNIDYRGIDRPGGGYPGTFTDVAKATDELTVKGQKFQLDLNRLVVLGHSAGGHLALWLAARAKLPTTSELYTANPLKIRHVISLGGLPDLEAAAISPDQGCGTDVIAHLVGKPTAARPDIYADTSIPRLLPIGATQDLVNGREDEIIPYRMATDYIAEARAAGDTATLHTIPATGHVELIAPESAAWRETRRLVHAALRQ